VVVEVDDSQVVRQSVEKLLQYHEDGNPIPPEYLTDERVVFWAKLKDKFRCSGKFDDEFLQKIHKIWTLWDEAAIAYEKANHSNEKRSPNSKKAFKTKARNDNGEASKYPNKRQRCSVCDVLGTSKTEKKDRVTSALDKILIKEIPDPSRTDFDLELAYEIGEAFEKAYQTWVKDNQHRGSKTKARQLVTMWHQQFSGKDTPQDMVFILERFPHAKNIIDKIKKLF